MQTTTLLASSRTLRAFPRAEKRYVRDLRALMRGMHQTWLAQAKPHLSTVARADGLWKFSGALDVLAEFLVRQLPAKVKSFFERMAMWLRRDNKTALEKVGVKGPDWRVDDAVSRALNANIDLMDKAGRAYVDDVRAVLESPEASTMTVKELTAELASRGSVSESRAQLIATDQTLKLNAAITRVRMENAGIESYIWSTCLDDRVRPTHAANEGETFTWASPPAETGHPGEDINCRCVAVPITA